MIHPAVRIVTLCVLVAFLSTGQISELVVGGIIVSVAAIMSAMQIHPVVTMLRRLRWFFISILIMFSWFTPGDPLSWLQFMGSLAPSTEGILLGLQRIAALVLIVLAVGVLLQSTSRDQLLGAIYWLARPFGVFGLSRELLAVRTTLVLERVDIMRQRLANVRGAGNTGERRGAITAAREVTVRLCWYSLAVSP